MLAAAYGVCDKLLSETVIQCCENLGADERLCCDALVLGSIMKGLYRLKIWPHQATPADIRMSVAAFAIKLQEIRCLNYPMSMGRHNRCMFQPRLSETIRTILDALPSAMLVSHQEHMKHQSSK